MRFLQNDPLGYAAGDANTYRYEGNGPTSGSDPSGEDSLKKQDMPNGEVHLYYSENMWFTACICDYTPIYIGTLRDDGYVYRNGVTVYLSNVEQRVRHYGTPDSDKEWDVWFKENKQEPPGKSSIAESWRKELGVDWDGFIKSSQQMGMETLNGVYVKGPMLQAAVASIGALGQLRCFRSFDSFKRAMGPAGEGRVWHHIVEQRGSNVTRFGAEAIHSTRNVVPIGATANQAIANYYSSIRPAISGSQTIRAWLDTQSFARQFEFGADILERVLAGKPLP